MTTKPITIGQPSPPTGLAAGMGGLRLNRARTASSSRTSSTDSYTPGATSPASRQAPSSIASSATSRRPSVSRHQSLASSPKLGVHPIENFLDLAQAKDASDAAMLKAALLRAAVSPSADKLLAAPLMPERKTHTAPLSRVPTGSHAWYTDAANPIVAGLQLRQTIMGGAKGVQSHVSQMPGGVQLVHMVVPRSIDPLVAQDIRYYGQSRYAAQLKPNLKTNTLLKIKFNGKTQPASDGYYACIIDQNDTLLVSLLSAPSVGAPAGAHANLAGGLPVRFAGELRIKGGRVAWLSNASGHYKTPGYLISQALTQPLLVDAQVSLLGI